METITVHIVQVVENGYNIIINSKMHTGSLMHLLINFIVILMGSNLIVVLIQIATKMVNVIYAEETFSPRPLHVLHIREIAKDSMHMHMYRIMLV